MERTFISALMENSKASLDPGVFAANEVIPGMFLGNLADVTAAPTNITHVVTVAARLRPILPAHIQHHTQVCFPSSRFP